MEKKKILLVTVFVILCVLLVYFGYTQNKGLFFGRNGGNEDQNLPQYGISGKVLAVFDTTIVLETEEADDRGGIQKKNRPVLLGSETLINVVEQDESGNIERTRTDADDIETGSTILVTSETDIRNTEEITASEIDIVRQ